jgi:hypothetical protein
MAEWLSVNRKWQIANGYFAAASEIATSGLLPSLDGHRLTRW